MADSAAENGAYSSRTRDHLVNERIDLSWLRIAATIMILGLASAKFANGTTLFSAATGGVRWC